MRGSNAARCTWHTPLIGLESHPPRVASLNIAYPVVEMPQHIAVEEEKPEDQSNECNHGYWHASGKSLEISI